ncbi:MULTISPECIES: helix-turn-helix transcriptional regulator [Paenibacillus]|uniref:HTH cro/C1-type domain-containing protein n=2 Tax=Paenibacillus TaxID=44249 RepID=A0A919XS69_9BACL|nr:DNA-binding helix-turn-helix protein [Paenibacillus sp. oral taxon 786 str. D14]GGG15379.1 hypothetical protein GCM10010913_41600 [Paenibacillus aceti]GIO38059.1 hypothetical protein J41TS12_29200 [Paenibacillus antibioticophila]
MLLTLKQIRKNNNKTCQEVADAVGISKVYYWQIENGKRKLYYDLAVKIAAFFNMYPDDIFLPQK